MFWCLRTLTWVSKGHVVKFQELALFFSILKIKTTIFYYLMRASDFPLSSRLHGGEVVTLTCGFFLNYFFIVILLQLSQFFALCPPLPIHLWHYN